MDPAVRGAIIAFMRRFGPRDSNPNIDAKEFELFCAYHIFNTELDLGLDDNELLSAVTGGEHDSQIDAILMSIDGEPILSEEDLRGALDAGVDETTDIRIVVIQATMHNDRQTEKIERFATGVENFFSDQPRFPMAQQIERWRRAKDLLYEHLKAQGIARKPRCDINLLWTRRNAEVTGHSRGTLEMRLEGILRRGLFREASFKILGEEQLLGLVQRAAIRNEITLRVIDHMSLPDRGPDGVIRRSLQSRVRGSDLLAACEGVDGRLMPNLFYGNVREYVGHREGSVNAGIARTLLSDERWQFIHRNNGALIVSRDIEMVEGQNGTSFVLKDAQIINGLQTINCLHDHKKRLDDGVEVLVKVICSNDDDTITDIVVASNSQNSFGPVELLSRMPFLRRLQQHFNAVTGPDQSPIIWLERRRRELSSLKEEYGPRVLDIEELMRAMISAYLCLPELAQNAHWDDLKALVPGRLLNDAHPMAIYHTAGLIAWRAREAIAGLKGANVSYPARNHLIYAMRVLAIPSGNGIWPGPAALMPREFNVASHVKLMHQVLLSPRSARGLAERADAAIRGAAAALNREFKASAMRDKAFTEKVAELAALAR